MHTEKITLDHGTKQMNSFFFKEISTILTLAVGFSVLDIILTN